MNNLIILIGCSAFSLETRIAAWAEHTLLFYAIAGEMSSTIFMHLHSFHRRS